MEKLERIFINHVDTYVGSNLAKFLSRCTVGSSMDEEEEEEAAEETEGFVKPVNEDRLYQIHGTLKYSSSARPPFVKAILNYDTREDFFEHIVESDVIVYDITDDITQIEEALWVAHQLHENIRSVEKEKSFVLVSSVMTWARSRATDSEDADAPLTEEDAKRRRPHPNFKDHHSAEKEVQKLGKKHKNKIRMYVVASGIPYGQQEGLLHDFFKKSWNGADSLPVFGNGSNTIPMIHISDLAGVIQNIADSKPAGKYIVAVDDSKNTLEEVVKAISATLSTGKTHKVTKEQSLLDAMIHPHDLEILLTDLRLDGTSIKDDMKIKWVSETGIVENIGLVVDEYRTSRNLTPIRAAILGPPGSGKTFYCERLATEYRLLHLNVKGVIDGYMKELVETIEQPTLLKEEFERKLANVNSAEDEEALNKDLFKEQLEEAENKASTATEMQEKLLKNMNENEGRLFDEDLAMIFKETMIKQTVLNHGFVLDGFPKTKEQAKLLFAPETEDENEKQPGFNPVVTPRHVFVIRASDKLLENRIGLTISADDSDADWRWDQFRQRLRKYRSLNDDLDANDEDTVLSFFDLREIHPIVLDLKEDLTKVGDEIRTETMETIRYELGLPHIYGPTEEEMVMISLRQTEEANRQKEMEKENRKKKEAEMMAIRKHNQNQWNDNLELVRQEMQERAEAQSLPLRNYLMKFVMPVLTEGLLDCSKVRTDDPIDFLSEFILRHEAVQSSEGIP